MTDQRYSLTTSKPTVALKGSESRFAHSWQKLLCIAASLLLVSLCQYQQVADAFQGRPPVPTVPEGPKTALFVAHFLVNTEITQMLDMADELTKLGHKSEFIVSTMYADNVIKRGYPVVAETPDMSKLEPWWTNWKVENMAKGIPARDYNEYFQRTIVQAFGASAELYEPSLVIIKDHLEARTALPDVMVASMFSDMAFDLSRYYDIPLAVNHAVPLGSLFDYEDKPAVPSGFLSGTTQDYQSFYWRLQKFDMFRRIMMMAIPMSFKINAIRAKYGLAPVNNPMEVLNKATWLVAYPYSLDHARNLRPLTKMLGFITNKYQPPAEGVEMSSDDQQLEQLLDEHSDGVVFAAFGSLTHITQGWFDAIVQGMADWQAMQSGNKTYGLIAIKKENREHLDISKIPANVKLLDWTNQKMILAHANTKAFITHAGQGSLAEGVHNQVPMLAFPLFADQFANADKIVEFGLGSSVNQRKDEVTADIISEKLQYVTSTPSIIDNLNFHYQTSARLGGAKSAAQVLEDMMLFGHLDHLVPIEERSSWVANTNADIYAVFLVTFVGSILVLKAVFKILLRKKDKSKTE
jgi:UDP-glucoronosyl and UDP-glucosyl transferase